MVLSSSCCRERGKTRKTDGNTEVKHMCHDIHLLSSRDVATKNKYIFAWDRKIIVFRKKFVVDHIGRNLKKKYDKYTVIYSLKSNIVQK